MSYRFSLCHQVIKKYGMSLMGQNIELTKYSHGKLVRMYFMDTAYTTILERYGIVVYVIFSIVFIMGMIYCFRSENVTLLIVLGMYSFYGIMEPNYLAMSYNIFLLALAYPIYGREISKGSSFYERVKYRFAF